MVSLVINKENLTCNDAAMKILVILMQEYFNDDNLERVVDERLLIYDHIKSFIELVKEIGVLNKPVVPFFNKELSYYEKKHHYVMQSILTGTQLLVVMLYIF